MRRSVPSVLLGAALSVLAWAPAAASSSVTLNGSFSLTVTKPTFTSKCVSGAGDECGVLQLAGLGAADYVYVYGPTFAPTGTKGCYTIDGTFSLTLRSDGSTMAGPLVGIFCRPGGSAAQHGTPSYGNPQEEHDTIAFSGGTRQFAGLQGTVLFTQSSAGSRSQGSLIGTLSP
jgi:hypothetical protein